MTEPEPTPLAFRLHAARRARGMTVKQLAAAALLDENTVQLIEAGHLAPSAQVKRMLARALRIDVQELRA